MHGEFFAGPHDGQFHFPVFRDFLDQVTEAHAEVVAEFDHALVVDLGITDFGDHIPLLQRIGGLEDIGFVDDDALDRFVEFEVSTERRVFERLEFVKHRRLTVVFSIGDILEEELHFLTGDDVADVVGTTQAAEGEADHLVADEGGTAAVAGVDGRVDLDTEAGGRKIIHGEFDPGNDALGDRETGAAGREAVDHHGIFDGGQQSGARQRRMGVEKRFVLELEHREIDARGDEFNRGRKLVAGLVGLHLHLAGIEHHVGVGEDTLPLDDDAGAGGFARGLFCPWFVGIGAAHRGEDLHHGVFYGVDVFLGGGFGGTGESSGEKGGQNCDAERAQKHARGGNGVIHVTAKRTATAAERQKVFLAARGPCDSVLASVQAARQAVDFFSRSVPSRRQFNPTNPAPKNRYA